MSKKEDTDVKSTTPAKETKKPAPKTPKKDERQLRVKFTEEEIIKLARRLAEKNAEAEQAELDKKAVTKQLASKCDEIAAQVSTISGKINAGFEYRQVQCETTYDDPKPGMKTTRRLDTLEIIEQETMTLAELQIDLPLGETTKMVGVGTNVGQVIDLAKAKATVERKPLRNVTGSGVVATEGDGSGEDLQDGETSKV